MMLPSYLTREQVRDVDRQAIADYGMTGLMLMENAGRGCADLLCKRGIDGPVVICCGKGNNGGDGFVIARQLEARGFAVRVLLFCDPTGLTGDAAANYQILVTAETPVFVRPDESLDVWIDKMLDGADWIVDALLGTGARGEPRAPFDNAIKRMNSHRAKKLAIDLPSGLDCDSGICASVTFRADHTCTFVATKQGFRSDAARNCLGEVHVIDIGVPNKLLAEFPNNQ